MAALAMGLVAASCNKMDFSNQAQISAEEALENAEMQLGATIDPNQDWNMTAEATANVAVFKDYGETYTVKVCTGNPMVDDVAYVVAQGTVTYGNTFTQKFSYASGLKKLYVAVSDSKGYTSVSAVAVKNGEVNATFGTPAVAAAPRRSQAFPAVADIGQPYDEAWVTTYCQTASEPNASNTTNNDANAGAGITTPVVMPNVSWGNYPTWCQYNQSMVTEADVTFYNNTFVSLWNAYNSAPQEYSTYNNEENYVRVNNAKIDKFMELYNAVVDFAGADGVSNWLNISQMPQKGAYGAGEYVTNFKITGTWTGGISVAASEGSQTPGCERTIVVKGTWNITEDQKIGSLGKIVIANGGTVNVASGKMLSMVNQARLVILPGGTLTGEGKVEVSNGNASGFENYNGGTVSVATFNNNFGKFYNYGKFLVNTYFGGAQESNFYNHTLAVIDHFGVKDGEGSTANARIFNGCQFYVKNDARIRNYEGTNGSALIVGGELMFSSSADGTSDPTYVGLEAGALVKCATLYNNGTSWSGPTSGYAALEITDKITFLNWEQDALETGGYFENNIYVKSATWNNVPGGNGYHQTDASDAANYALSIASYKFFNIVANCRGNNGVTKVVDGNAELLPADSNFSLGKTGCTPGFKGEGDPGETTTTVWSYAFEDTYLGDYDLNDVVLKVKENGDNIDVWLVAAGATLDLEIRLYDYDETKANEEHPYYGSTYTTLSYNNETEIHKMWNVEPGTMINTGLGANVIPIRIAQLPTSQYEADKLRFTIKSNVWEVFLSGSGTGPYGVMIPWDWKWPTERVRITKAYNKTNSGETEPNQSFTNFMENAGHAELWYKYPTGSVKGDVIIPE